MKILRIITDYATLLFLTAVIIVFSALMSVRYIWPETDYEQLLIMIRDVSIKVIISNSTWKDYLCAILTFAIVYPFCYFYLNTKGRFYMALLFSGLILYFSGFATYHIYSHSTSRLYEEEYIFPEKIKFDFPEKKRNLILIYLESFEHNFSQTEQYGKNLLPNLSSFWKEGNHSLSHQPMYGTDFSIASLVSSHCGIPLRYTYINDIWALKFFLPQAVCFPEILKQNGYQTAIVKAADITFTRVNIFAKTHGYDEALGVDEILQNFPKESHSARLGTFGGVTDETLFTYAKEKLMQFPKDKPFMLTLFSLDTHTPTPHHNPKCQKVFGDIRDVYMCTDKTVYDFVTWLKASPYWENTTVVIMGDHLYPSRIKAKGHPKRGTYNVFLNLPENLQINKNMAFSTFDMAPTILESLGIKFSEKAFGLGRSLFFGPDTLLQRLGRQKLKSQLIKDSNLYKTFNLSTEGRKEEFTPYTPETRLVREDFIKYSDSYEDVLGNYYLDKLSLKLPNSSAQKYTVFLKFRALKTYSNHLTILANGKEIFAYDIDYNTQKPAEISFDIPAKLTKDGKLTLTFRKDTGRLTAAQMGINPIEMILTEK